MLNKYQKEAAIKFKNHHHLDREQARLLNWAVGLGGEAGEVQELIKHVVFAEETMNKMDLAKELGDVLWYVSAIATSSGINMEDVAELNLAKLNHRYNSGEYTDGEAQDRRAREKQFTDTPIYKTLRARILGDALPTSIIFVGPDGAGKTTIAKEVATRMKFDYHKCDYRQDNKQQVGRDLISQRTNVVYDRFYWPDEMIYCHAKGITQTPAYWAAFAELIEDMQKYNIVYVYVTASEAELIKRSAQWADDYIKLENLKSVMAYYDDWLATGIIPSTYPVISIDTTGIIVDSPEYTELLDAVCKGIKACVYPY